MSASSNKLEFETRVSPEAGSIRAQLMQEAAPTYFDGLNEPQKEAVEALDGPVLVLACAGTGKTRVLTSRMAHLLSLGKARPSEILAVTFTNKAAFEMKQRVGKLTGQVVEGMPWLGTFHSVSARILRRHAELAGLRPDFTILDTDDQLRLLKQILEAAKVDIKASPPRALLGLIDHYKNRAWGPDDVPTQVVDDGFGSKVTDYYRQYQTRLKQLNAVDFGDLILETINILRGNPEVLARYHNQFRYILVDEYQDTNIAQYLWLRLLAQGRQNLCCVGDDDQSIYGWRGAEVGNILRFERDFPEAKIVRLEENYRSTASILAAASHLIAHNEKRLKKTLKTTSEEGEKVLLIGAWDSEEEARQISDEIEHFCQMGQDPNEIAILVRTSSQMRAFEDRFAMLGLPYRVIGGPKFYERQEIRDAIAYFRLINQINDDLAFERIVNKPKRGFGDTSLQRLIAFARNAGLPLFIAARQMVETDELRGQARVSLRRFVEDIDRWRAHAEDKPPRDLAEMILEESGYIAMWQADKSADSPGRLENLKELVRSLDDYDRLGEFLEHIALVLDSGQGEESKKVSLMTLHAAKGLEFEVVYLPGWEDGLFPSQRSLDDVGRAGLEEERRLAYVGITRAKRHLRITFAANRRIYGMWQSSAPSRFIDELPAEHVEILGRKPKQGFGQGFGSANSFRRPSSAPPEQKSSVDILPPTSSFDQTPQQSTASNSPGWQRLQAAREAAAHAHQKLGLRPKEQAGARPPGPALPVGQRVFHQKFGYGEITEIEDDKALVNFEHTDPKRVLTSFLTIS